MVCHWTAARTGHGKHGAIDEIRAILVLGELQVAYDGELVEAVDAIADVWEDVGATAVDCREFVVS